MTRPPFRRVPGLFRVVHMHGKEVVMRDFDAEEWSYEWRRIMDGQSLLVLCHDNAPWAAEQQTFDFVEFATPVSIEFIQDDV